MLNTPMRGILDKIIDQVIISIPLRLPSLRKGEAKELQVRNEEDYMLGFAHGAIMNGFVTTFSAIHRRPTDYEEDQEALRVALNRTPELRDAISKRGYGKGRAVSCHLGVLLQMFVHIARLTLCLGVLRYSHNSSNCRFLKSCKDVTLTGELPARFIL